MCVWGRIGPVVGGFSRWTTNGPCTQMRSQGEQNVKKREEWEEGQLHYILPQRTEAAANKEEASPTNKGGVCRGVGGEKRRE